MTKVFPFIKTDSFKDEFLNPLSEVFDNLFRKQFPKLENVSLSSGAYPKVDVIDYPDKVTIIAEIAGWAKNEVKVTLHEGQTLIIKGHRRNDEPDLAKGAKFILKEIKRSTFQRSFILSDKLDTSNITSKFDAGVLTVEIKKISPSQKTTDSGIDIEIK